MTDRTLKINDGITLTAGMLEDIYAIIKNQCVPDRKTDTTVLYRYDHGIYLIKYNTDGDGILIDALR